MLISVADRRIISASVGSYALPTDSGVDHAALQRARRRLVRSCATAALLTLEARDRERLLNVALVAERNADAYDRAFGGAA